MLFGQLIYLIYHLYPFHQKKKKKKLFTVSLLYKTFWRHLVDLMDLMFSEQTVITLNRQLLKQFNLIFVYICNFISAKNARVPTSITIK